MSTWEERMAQRAAWRRFLADVEAHANDEVDPHIVGSDFIVVTGFEVAPITRRRGIAETLPPDEH